MVAFFIFLTFCGSVVITLQKVVNAALGEKIGYMESSFVNHLVGAVFAGLLLIVGFSTGHIYFEGIPFYLFCGGFLGVFLVFFINYAIPVIGVMATLICLILSQLIISSIIDHYGLFGGNLMEIEPGKIVGVILIVIGAFLTLSKKKIKPSNEQI